MREAPACAGASFVSGPLRSPERYGVGSLSSIARLVLVSHGPVDPPTPEPAVGVNTACHEMLTGESPSSNVTVVAGTLPFVVLRVAGDATLVNVMSGSVYSGVPLHVLPLYILKTSVPDRFESPADVIVALSFGSQTWSLRIELVS